MWKVVGVGMVEIEDEEGLEELVMVPTRVQLAAGNQHVIHIPQAAQFEV